MYNTQNEKCTILNLIVIFESRENFKVDVEDLFLLEYKLLKIRTKIKEFNTVENVKVSQNSNCHWVFKLLQKMCRPS